MTRPVNTLAIGGFVLGAALILFGLAFYLGGNAFRGDTDKVVMVFDGSVKGLKIGAPVAFKGVQIGEVTRISVVVDTDSYDVIMPVEVRINNSRIRKIGSAQDENSFVHLLKKGMRAQLQTQSLLTGLLYIQLDFHPDSEIRVFDYETDLVHVPTIPTDMERLTRHLDNIDFGKLLEGIEATIDGMDKFINDPETRALAGNLNETLDALAQLSGRLRAEIDEVSPGFNQLISNTDETMQLLHQELPALTQSAQASLEELTAALQAAQTTLGHVDYTLSDDSAVLYDVRKAANELGAASRALQSLAETLETQPESLLKGKSPLGN
jgi:paraquat-inducible protein B